MKTCLTLLLSALLSCGAFSQSQYVRNFNDDVHTIIPCKDSTYYAISIHPGCGINSFSVHYLDRKGEIIWSKESSLWVTHLYNFKGYTDDANTLTIVHYSGTYNGLTRIDHNGNVLFYRSFNPNTYEFSSIIKGDTGFFLTGVQQQFTNNPSVSTLVHMNDDGTVNWVKSYNVPNFPRLLFNDVIRTGDSLLIVGHHTAAGFPEVTFPCLLKTDLNGNVGSSYYYRIETIDVDRYKFWEVDSYDPSSIYLKFRASAGVDGILKINNQLQVEWAQNCVGDLGTICAAYDGGVLFTGSFAFDGDIAQMNAQGTVVNITATDCLPSLSTPSQIQRHDCGYLIALPMGWPNDRYAHISQELNYCQDVAGGNADMYAISTVNRLGLTISTQQVPISDFSMFTMTPNFTDIVPTETADCEATFTCNGSLQLEEKASSPLEIYPNPVENVLYFDHKFDRVMIINAMGRIVYDEQLNNNEVPVADFAPGVYQVICGNRWGRFLKL